MTEREKKMIEAYTPSPRDPDLPENEYYCRDMTHLGYEGWEKLRMLQEKEE